MENVYAEMDTIRTQTVAYLVINDAKLVQDLKLMFASHVITIYFFKLGAALSNVMKVDTITRSPSIAIVRIFLMNYISLN